MPFCIGGHPGFNIPIQSDEVFEDYDIVFEEKEEQKCPTLDMKSCLIDFEKTNFELDDTDTIRCSTACSIGMRSCSRTSTPPAFHLKAASPAAV